MEMDMNKKILFVIALSFITNQAFSDDKFSRLILKQPTKEQKEIILNIYGEDFIKGKGGFFKNNLLVSKKDFNGDNKFDLVVVQNAFCSNHACEFNFIENENGSWKEIASISSWAIPYVNDKPKGKLCDIVIFDHITDDCEACSEPKPVRYECKSDSKEPAMVGPIPKRESKSYKVTW
jgi:hypothetical protein